VSCTVCLNDRIYRRGLCQVDYRLALRGERRELSPEARYRILQRNWERELLRRTALAYMGR
jgi:hypothetical protein